MAGSASDSASLLCPACGYDLRGLSQLVCPECGGHWSLEAVRAARPAEWRLTLAPTGALLALLAALLGLIKTAGNALPLGLAENVSTPARQMHQHDLLWAAGPLVILSVIGWLFSTASTGPERLARWSVLVSVGSWLAAVAVLGH